MASNKTTRITQNLYYTGNIYNPNAVKGDILVNNDTSFVLLNVGADGTVLISNSAQPTGLEWGTATGSSFAYGGCFFSNTGGTSYTITSTTSVINLTRTSTSLSADITHTSPFKLTYTGSVTKVFNIEGSASLDSSDTHNIYIALNGTDITASFAQQNGGGGGGGGSLAALNTFITISLAQNDFVELFLQRPSGTASRPVFAARLNMISNN
jgi:hypothetical protein